MLHNTLDNVSRKLHKSGVGTLKAQARVITTQVEEILWTTDIVGTTSPKFLLNAVSFYCEVYLCLHGGDEHRDLKYSQFELGHIDNPENMLEKIEILKYTELWFEEQARIYASSAFK